MAAYATRFRAVAETISGKTVRVDIQQDGYKGAIVTRAFGETPRLRVSDGTIMSSSLEFALECKVTDEFVDLYTSSATEFRVLCYHDGYLVFSGFITPELYASSWVDPPYDVKITASDNLAELKSVKWTATERLTLQDIFYRLLDVSGTDFRIFWATSMRAGTMTAQETPNGLFAGLASQSGNTYYDVLEKILVTLHAHLVQLRGRWVIFRETDLSSLVRSGSIFATDKTNLCGVHEFGSARDNDVWPVDHLTCEIHAAHNSQTLSYTPEWSEDDIFPTGYLRFPDMAESVYHADEGEWEISGPIMENSQYGVRIGIGGVVFEKKMLPGTGSEPITVRFTARTDMGAEGVFRICVYNPLGSTSRVQSPNLLDPLPGEDLTLEYFSQRISVSDNGKPTEVSVTVPGFVPSDKIIAEGGVYKIVVFNEKDHKVFLSGVSVVYGDTWPGVDINVNLDNSARTPADSVDLAVLDCAPGTEAGFVGNSWSLDKVYDVPFYTSAITAGEHFRTLIARDYAFSHAMPRLQIKGTLSTFGYGAKFPVSLIYLNRDMMYIATSLNWDIYNSEMEVELISLPAAALEIKDMTITTTTGSGGSSGGSHGSGGSSSTVVSDSLKAYVDEKVQSLVDGSPAALDTLYELANALGNDPNFAATMSTELGKKANSADLGTIASKNAGDYILNTAAGLSDAIHKLAAGTATPQGDDYYVCQTVGGGSADHTYTRRPVSSLWNLFKWWKIETAKKADEATNAEGADALNNLYSSRPSSADLQKGDGKLRYFMATSSMSSGKPTLGDSQILHMAWDNNGGWDGEVAVANRNAGMQYRTQNNGSWLDWKTLIDSGNIGQQSVANAANAADADKLDGLHAESFAFTKAYSNNKYRCIKAITVTREGRGHLLFTVSGVTNGANLYYVGMYGIKFNSGDSVTPVFYKYFGYNWVSVGMVKVSETQYDIYVDQTSGAWGGFNITILGARNCSLEYPGTGYTSAPSFFTTSTPTMTMSPYIEGNVRATGWITANGTYSSSDKRLKNIIRDIDLSPDDIADAPAVEFAWKNGGQKAVGSIAQYWEKVLPLAVHETEDGHLSMQYDVTALLSAVILARENRELKAKVRSLEERLEAVEGKLGI